MDLALSHQPSLQLRAQAWSTDEPSQVLRPSKPGVLTKRGRNKG